MKKTAALFCILIATLAAGCKQAYKHAAGEAQTDQNVMTGGPVTGTTLDDLPQAVRDTIQRLAPDAEIADIDRVKRDGEEVFQISFSESGKNPKIYVASSGRILPNPDLTKSE